jgi:hypothetical protein
MFLDTRFVQNGVSVRCQSTSTHTAIQNIAKVKKKKVRRFRKKYAELVEGKKLMSSILI